MTKHLARIGVMLALAAVGCSATAASTTFYDGVLSNADWSGSIASQSGPPVSFTAQQVAAGGNPGFFREVGHTFGGPGSIITSHLFTGGSYNPVTQGAIADIDFSADLFLFNGGDSGAVGYGALLSQGGTVYIAGFGTTTTPFWIGFSLSDLTASNFSKLSGAGPVTPDFSATGGVIQLGYFASNGTGIARSTSTLSGLDNWSVTVTTAVPEPGTYALLATGLIGLLVRRRMIRTPAPLRSGN